MDGEIHFPASAEGKSSQNIQLQRKIGDTAVYFKSEIIESNMFLLTPPPSPDPPFRRNQEKQRRSDSERSFLVQNRFEGYVVSFSSVLSSLPSRELHPGRGGSARVSECERGLSDPG